MIKTSIVIPKILSFTLLDQKVFNNEVKKRFYISFSQSLKLNFFQDKIPLHSHLWCLKFYEISMLCVV